MAIAKALCDFCGKVDITTGDIQIRVCLDNNQMEYKFRCPKCQFLVFKKLGEDLMRQLIDNYKVEIEVWSLPEYEQHNGKIISHDDVIDLHKKLDFLDKDEEFTDYIWGELES